MLGGFGYLPAVASARLCLPGLGSKFSRNKVEVVVAAAAAAAALVGQWSRV